MPESAAACPACGATGTGRFCAECGAPRPGAACPGCGSALAAGARFCSGCGRALTGSAGPPARDRTPWIIAGVALAALLAVLLAMLSRSQSPRLAAQPETAGAAASTDAETPPDIGNMSPRERFNRLYNRVMQAAQSGDQATVTRFTPMALMAYAQLDTVDADARYHAALMKVHTGEVEGSRALADTLLAENPGHLFGYMIQGTVARFRKDDQELSRAYSGFLKRYDPEMKLGRPEYGEHQTSLDTFRKAALAQRAEGRS